MGEEKVHIYFRYYSLFLRKATVGVQGRRQKAGTEAETTKKCCLLSCPQVLIQIAFSYSPGTTVNIHRALGHHIPTVNQDNAPYIRPEVSLIDAVLQL